MFIHLRRGREVMFRFGCLHYSLACVLPEVQPLLMVAEPRLQPCYWQSHMDFISYSSLQPQRKRSTRAFVWRWRQSGVFMRESKKRKRGNNEEASLCVCMCVCVRLRSQFHPIYFGGIVLETAPFLDAIITQAAQGLSREMLPYIKVLLINIDWFVQLEGISVPISASHTTLLM